MRLKYGAIVLGKYHFDRLFDSMAFLKYNIPPALTPELLERNILELSRANACTSGARIRLSVFRGNGGLIETDHPAEYLIECEKLEQPFSFNTQGLKIDIYPFAQKARDAFSNLKSSSYLAAAMAAKFAKDHKLDDCILLNCNDDLAESTIANLFMITQGTIFTPALSEGCVHGVMRRYLLGALQDTGYTVEEGTIHGEQLASADEVFLTNAIKGIQWVSGFRDSNYTNEITHEIFNRFIRTIQS